MLDTDSLIKKYCRELKIGKSIYENYSSIEAQNNAEFLAKLLEKEVEERELRRRSQNLKAAGFDVFKTFDNYEFGDIQIPSTLGIEELKNGSFIEKCENLIFYGAVGTGKTHLATAIGTAACSRGKTVKFFRTAVLVNLLIEAKNNGELKKTLKNISKAELLICDEWGYIPFDKEGAQLLFQVISECYERKSLIITTNLEFSRWNGIFYDEKLTSAIIDRLVHHSHLLIFQGESYRLAHSMMKIG